MNRVQLERYITNNYGVGVEYPWTHFPSYAVFRHEHNRKWFAVIMDLSKEKLGLQEMGEISVVNFKCDPLLIGALLSKSGFFPAYHMNKEKWITVALDGSVTEEQMKMLLDMSYELTIAK